MSRDRDEWIGMVATGGVFVAVGVLILGFARAVIPLPPDGPAPKVEADPAPVDSRPTWQFVEMRGGPNIRRVRMGGGWIVQVDGGSDFWVSDVGVGNGPGSEVGR